MSYSGLATLLLACSPVDSPPVADARRHQAHPLEIGDLGIEPPIRDTVPDAERPPTPARAPATKKRAVTQHGAASTKHSGRLPPEVIQRIVRAGLPRFRLCYESNLRN